MTAPLAIIGLTILTLVVEYAVQRKKGKPVSKYILYCVYGSLALWSLTDYSRFWARAHYYEIVVHYMGSKYYREVGYRDLYKMLFLADTELDNSFQHIHWVMSLSTRNIVRKESELENAQQAKSRFSEERWSSFKRDTRYFIAKLSPFLWEDLFLDHGLNTTPFWATWTGVITNLRPATDDFIFALVQIDKAAFGLSFLFVGLAFGLRVMLLCLIFACTNSATPAHWISGSILRFDWLVFTSIGIWALQKHKYLISGVMLTLATCSRILPGMFMLSLFIKWGDDVLRRKERVVGVRSFLKGAIFSGLTVLCLSLCYGGTQQLVGFYDNLQLYGRTILSNSVGVRSVVIYQGEGQRSDLPLPKGDVLVREAGTDQRYIDWRDNKYRLWKRLSLVLIPAALVFLLLFVYCSRFFSETDQALLGAILIYTFLTPNNYYFVFLIFLLAVFVRKVDCGKHLFWAVSLFLSSVPLYFVHRGNQFMILNFFVYSLALIVWTVLFYSVLLFRAQEKTGELVQ